MKIQEVVDSLDDVQEDLRENYVEGEDGTFVLSLITGLKSALTKTRDEVKAVKANLTTVTEERDALSTETHSAKEEAEKAKKDSVAAAALQKVNGNISLLQSKVAERLGFNEAGEVIVVDESGTPVLNEEGSAETVDGLVTQMRADPDLAGAFKGSGSAGGGTPPLDKDVTNGGSRIETPSRRSEMTPRQKVEYIRENGDESYQSLPY